MLEQIVPEKDYTVIVEDSHPSIREYSIRICICSNSEKADKAGNKYLPKFQKISTNVYGVFLPKLNVDNREWWVLAGSFSSKEEALAFRKKTGEVPDGEIIELIIQPATGTLMCGEKQSANQLRIVPAEPHPGVITIKNVLVGIGFHWQHYETQSLCGFLEIVVNNEGKLTAIDVAPVEEYLASVNSSEMRADCPAELLKAQTVAARSTIFATMGKHHYSEPFHLCADDHCQDYHGYGAIKEVSRQAAQSTYGEVLMFENHVCDARYAKICGGVTEDYKNVWDAREIPYLTSVLDSEEPIKIPLEDESVARNYIDSSPDVYCNTTRYSIPESLSEAKKLFRWEVEYTRQELQDIISQKLAVDFGELMDIVPGKRGVSGRLMDIKIIGTLQQITVKRELEIRRVLSKSHLYSSCFYIQRERDSAGAIKKFILRGAGWGHGVGMCQIGAGVMAARGFGYDAILRHYYKGAQLQRIY